MIIINQERNIGIQEASVRCFTVYTRGSKRMAIDAINSPRTGLFQQLRVKKEAASLIATFHKGI